MPILCHVHHDPSSVSEWVSSFLTAHQHILGYSVPFIHSVLFTVWQIYIKDGYNQGYLATVKMNEEYLRLKERKNNHKT